MKNLCNRIYKNRAKIFYSLIASFAVICMVQLYNIISISKPKHKVSSPHLEIRPIVNATLRTVFIRYDENDIATVEKWITLLDNFIELYKTENLGSDAKLASSCNFNRPPKENEICPVDVEKFGPCNPPYYGYYSFSPCIFLKLSKVYNWVPECYNVSRNLPSSMPADLIAHIKQASSRNKSKQVWVSCEGLHEADKEHVEQFNYYPSRGFPSYFYPVTYKTGKHLSPLVAVEIVNPTPGVFINIQCRAWAKNIDFKADTFASESGLVQFTIMRDELVDQEYKQETW